jgi:hypothetical protein
VFVHTRGYETTPAPADSARCPRCKGLGMAPGGPGSDPGPCETCDSTGRVVYSGRKPERKATERKTYFLAVQGVDVLDVGTNVERLAAEVAVDRGRGHLGDGGPSLRRAPAGRPGPPGRRRQAGRHVPVSPPGRRSATPGRSGEGPRRDNGAAAGPAFPLPPRGA